MAKYGLCSHVVTNGIYDKKCSHICNHTNHIFDLESVNKIMWTLIRLSYQNWNNTMSKCVFEDCVNNYKFMAFVITHENMATNSNICVVNATCHKIGTNCKCYL